MKRSTFLTAGGAAAVGTLGAASGPAIAQSGSSARLGRRALILSGGGARGAYEAGAVQALVDQQHLSDGQPLDFDMVCGTSIGGLNGYFIATAQYSLLKHLWLDVIPNAGILRVKQPYEKINDANAGLVSRLDAALDLGKGLVNGLLGVIDTTGIRTLLRQYVGPGSAVHLPFYAATTNLTRQLGQAFVRRATTPVGLQKQSLNDSLLEDYTFEKIREADDAILHDVLYATAAIPIAFDPAEIPRTDGTGTSLYVDGGVTENVPINIARRCAEVLHVVLVDPPRETLDVTYPGAVSVGLGVFSTMQYRILQYQILLALVTSTPQNPVQPFVMRPAEPLPGKFEDFGNAGALAAMWNVGYNDGITGWRTPSIPAIDTLQ